MLELGYIPLLLVIAVLILVYLLFRFVLPHSTNRLDQPKIRRSVSDLYASTICPHCRKDLDSADALLAHLPLCPRNRRQN